MEIRDSHGQAYPLSEDIYEVTTETAAYPKGTKVRLIGWTPTSTPGVHPSRMCPPCCSRRIWRDTSGSQQISAVKDELIMRKRCYPRFVREGRMKLAVFAAVLETLQQLQAQEAAQQELWGGHPVEVRDGLE